MNLLGLRGATGVADAKWTGSGAANAAVTGWSSLTAGTSVAAAGAASIMWVVSFSMSGGALSLSVAATGADLLWRAMGNMKPRHVETLADGTWLAELRPSGNEGRHGEGLIIRVIDYELDDGRVNDTTYRLFTTLLDPVEAPAEELALAYAQRWEIESTFDELKTHQRGARTVLRSKSPGLVLQEIWGHLCCHYAIRTLMFEAADHAHVDPDRVSFVAALRIARR